LGSSAVVGPSWRGGGRRGGGEDPWLAIPAFTGCAFLEGIEPLMYAGVPRLSTLRGHRFSPSEIAPTELRPGIRPILDLEPSGLGAVWIGLPLGHDALQVELLGGREHVATPTLDREHSG
jgi:hypothetical protein